MASEPQKNKHLPQSPMTEFQMMTFCIAFYSMSLIFLRVRVEKRRRGSPWAAEGSPWAAVGSPWAAEGSPWAADRWLQQLRRFWRLKEVKNLAYYYSRLSFLPIKKCVWRNKLKIMLKHPLKSSLLLPNQLEEKNCVKNGYKMPNICMQLYAYRDGKFFIKKKLSSQRSEKV